jgi:radical SAM superfamily enzyme YgiQ (UPF0313 family)
MSGYSDAFPFKHFEAYLPSCNTTFHNPPFGDASYRVLIARLSPFRDVDRSIPHLFLYQQVRRSLPGAYVDLAFFPSAPERELLVHGDIPFLIGIQSREPAAAFDLVLISNAYTLELINLPYLLLRSGIPLYASQRGPEWPILLLGGSNAMAAQAVICQDGDSLVDGVFFGEGEDAVERIVSILAQSSRQDKGLALREAAARVEGLWVSGSLHSVSKAVCRPDAQHLAIDYPLLNSPEVHTANLQINYGCPAFCSFCFEGYDRKPYREVPLHDLLPAARQLKRAQGIQEINLYSFNFNTYSEILPLLLELHHLFYRVGIKSQRVDILQHTDGLVEAEVEADKRSFTLGIEGISERQRTWLHKSLPTSDILSLLDRLFASKIREIKLFYLLTGHETADDVDEYRAFMRQVKAIRRARNPGIRVIFSFGLLVRMPFTPLRYDRLFLDEQAWRPLIGQVKSASETNNFEFRLAFDWQTYCVTQVLALGGYWLIEPLVELAEQGYCYDTALPEGYWDRLRRWMIEAGHWNDAFLGEKGPDDTFALDFVSSNVAPDFLYRQYQEARAGSDGGYCLGGQDRRGRCLGCGACVDSEQREAITHHQVQIPETGPYLSRLRDLVARKRRLRPVYYVLRFDDLEVGVRPEYLNALAMIEILALYPEWVDNLLVVRESLLTVSPSGGGRRASKRGRFPTMSGESVFALYAWEAEGLRRALSETRGAAQDRFAIVGPAEGFSPGVFATLHLDLGLAATHFDQPRHRLETYLRDAYVPYSLRREDALSPGATRYCFQVPEKGLKKKVLFGGYFEVGETGLDAGLEIGPRFDLRQLLEQFGPSYHLSYAKLRTSHIRW